MLQDIRDNSQSTIAKIIVAAVILSLSVFGVDAIIGGFGGEPAVATVNGEDITEREFQRAAQIRRQQMLQEMDRPDPALLDEGAINQQVLEGLIDSTLLYQDARDRGIDLSEAEIDQLITSMPAFQVDNQFSQERFASLVRNRGMGVQEFRDALRRDFMAQQVRMVVAGGAFANPQMVRDVLALQQQQRDIATLTLDESLVADEVQVSDAEVEAFYQENDERFMEPETVDVAWIELDRAALKEDVEVTEEEVRTRYEERLATLEASEERRAAHILLVPESGEEVEQARIEEVQQALDQADDFAAVAEQYSDDPGSASAGGDLGFASRETFDGAFADALFAIESEGEVVGPVESQYGVHFIQLNGVREQDKPAFREMRDNLRDEIASERANQRYLELTDRLADTTFSAFDLEEPAAELGLEIEQREGITRQANAEPFDHAGLLRQLFSEDVLADGNNTELVEVADGVSVVARVAEHHPEQKLELEEVAGDIRDFLTAQKVREALNEQAEDWIQALREGADPESVAAEAQAEWVEVTNLMRGSSELPAPVVDATFRMPQPEEGPTFGRANVATGVTLIRLDEVVTPTIGDQNPSLGQAARVMSQQQGAQAASLYLEALRQQAEIERL